MLIFMEGGKPENPVKNPRDKGENNTSNKLSSHLVTAGLELATPGPQDHCGERRRVNSERHPCHPLVSH